MSMSITETLKEKREKELKEREHNPDLLNSMSKNLNIKKTLMSCMDMEKFIEKTKEIVDSSEHFRFKNDRSKKFIDHKNPVFLLSCTLLDDVKVKDNKPDEVDKWSDKITPLIRDELVHQFSDYVTECVSDKDKFDLLFKNLPEEFSSTYLTRIYIVNVNPAENVIILKYFV